jgi:hypothetical protein
MGFDLRLKPTHTALPMARCSCRAKTGRPRHAHYIPCTRLARATGFRSNAAMRGGSVLVLLAITAFGAFSVGPSERACKYSIRRCRALSPPVLVKPVAFTSPTVQPTPVPTPTPLAKVEPPAKPAQPDTKRKVEAVLTAAAIAAIIIQASRDQYHAGGRPCACPDDHARNGGSCGGRSAYSRPGGAAPLCYPGDVPATMIEAYRQRQASR